MPPQEAAFKQSPTVTTCFGERVESKWPQTVEDTMRPR
jgi:hypothetical protein